MYGTGLLYSSGHCVSEPDIRAACDQLIDIRNHVARESGRRSGLSLPMYSYHVSPIGNGQV
jgi:hypothetical protein